MAGPGNAGGRERGGTEAGREPAPGKRRGRGEAPRGRARAPSADLAERKWRPGPRRGAAPGLAAMALRPCLGVCYSERRVLSGVIL
ncbi:unnamed protein product [Bubo scandiacus]